MKHVLTLAGIVVATFAAAAPVAAQTVLVPQGSVWRYRDNGVFPGAQWKTLGFNHASWAMGPAQLGYGDNDEATVVSFGPNPNAKFITTWFRQIFNVADPSQVANLRLRLLRDDGAVVYLNGVEIVRTNIAPGAVGANTLAQVSANLDEEGFFFAYDVDPDLLVAGANILAVEVHQSEGTSSDVSFDLELAGNVAPSVIRGPYLQQGSESAQVLCWRTDVATDARVWIGSSPANLAPAVDTAAVDQDHELRVTGLLPETTYFYAVGTSTAQIVGGDAAHFFVTAPTPGADHPLRIWVLGDSGTADAAAEAVRDSYYAKTAGAHTDLVLMLGDNAYDIGADHEYEFAVFQMYADVLRNTTLWPTRGNHEFLLGDYLSIFALPAQGEVGGMPSGTEEYYSFDCANVHFVCLDSEGSSRAVGGPMWTWAESDLSSTDQDWIVAFWHHPPYSKGSHDSDTEIALVEMRSNFLPLLEAWGVDLVLAGHSHSYERSFLIDGHYGVSATFDPQTMLRDGGDGSPSGDGAYEKAVGPHEGAVYCVAGSSGKVSDAPLDHPVMHLSLLDLGSLVMEVDGDHLAVRFLDIHGNFQDEFEIANVPPLSSPSPEISMSGGGSQVMRIEAGIANAGSNYRVLGSFTGTSPGVDLGGGVLLPIVVDPYTWMTLKTPNTLPFKKFKGLLGADGSGAATLTLPPGSDPGWAGITLYHAYYTVSTPFVFDFASNALTVTFVP